MWIQTDETKVDTGLMALLQSELNVKSVNFTPDARAFTTYKLKPQLRTLGRKYGKLVPAIGAALAAMDGNDAMDTLLGGKVLAFEVQGEAVELLLEDVLYESANKHGYVAASEGSLRVALDTRLTEELIEEGFVREVISKVQTMRKEAGFEVVDHITLYHAGNDRIAHILSRFGAQIAAEVLAAGIAQGQSGYTKQWDINGEVVTFSVVKV